MYYQPRHSNGKLIKNAWNLRAFRALNQIAWPLDDEVSIYARFLDRFYWFCGFLIFLLHSEAELRYLFYNFNNIDNLLTGVPTYAVLVEIHLRAFQMGWVKEQFKEKLLKKFYAEIFIKDKEDPQIYADIYRKLRLTRIVTIFYFCSFVLLISQPFMNFLNDIREPLYKMSFVYDISSDFIYFTIVTLNLWVGLIVVSIIFGELSLAGQIILHLNGRFRMLQKDLEICSMKLLKGSSSSDQAAIIAYEFQLKLQEIIQRNVELYKFGREVQQQFSFRFFIWFLMSSLLLCACGFKAYTNPDESIGFLGWAFTKLIELGTIGELGSTLLETTNEVSSMYYHSNWELIIARSTNKLENIRLMKTIIIAMETNHKPIYLNGLNFFTISLSTVMTIIQAAGSYFTCLISLR